MALCFVLVNNGLHACIIIVSVFHVYGCTWCLFECYIPRVPLHVWDGEYMYFPIIIVDLSAIITRTYRYNMCSLQVLYMCVLQHHLHVLYCTCIQIYTYVHHVSFHTCVHIFSQHTRTNVHTFLGMQPLCQSECVGGKGKVFVQIAWASCQILWCVVEEEVGGMDGGGGGGGGGVEKVSYVVLLQCKESWWEWAGWSIRICGMFPVCVCEGRGLFVWGC